MSFAEAVRTCFAKYVTFSGRAARPEYWWFLLAVILASLVAGVLDGAMGFDTEGPVSALVSLGTFLPLLAAAWRRLHDTGRSGWWALLPIGGGMILMLFAATFFAISEQAGGIALGAAGLAILAIYVLVIVWLASRGDPDANRYGPPPAR